MRRNLMVAMMAFGLLVVMAAPAAAGNGNADHTIASKHDHMGSFTGNVAGYDWDGFSGADTEWTFKIHAKEAAAGEYSRGTVHFSGINPDGSRVNVVGQVKYAEQDYPYWTNLDRDDVLALAGTTTYMGESYFFMYLESEQTVWLALSTADYAPYLESDTVFPGAERAFQIHSAITEGQFELPEKVIHG